MSVAKPVHHNLREAGFRKVMLPQFTLHKDLIKRFHREAQAVARLEHPHIVKIYEIGLTPTTNQPFLIMEYVPGGTIFYFKENRQNTYVLLNDQNIWRAIQEK